MKNQAFTLIELLVVVLIIGILAAIAVPQYQVAVGVSRIKSMMPMLNSIYQAEQTYYLANGKYTENFDDLDADLPPSTVSGCGVNQRCYKDYYFQMSDKVIYGYLREPFMAIQTTRTKSYWGCWPHTKKTSDIRHKICRAISTDTEPNENNAYLITH